MRREEEEQRKVQEALKAARSEWEADRLRKERIEMEEERRKSIERRAMEEASARECTLVLKPLNLWKTGKPEGSVRMMPVRKTSWRIGRI